jgi:tripartite-type tricarboxylate transporter receptor subunit TctC
MITRRAALAGVALLPVVAARAEPAFPSKPLTLIVPFPAGGPADIFGRFLAQGMSTDLGKPIVVENKSGVAGVTGMDFVAKSGDAHVMGIMSASAGAIMQSLMPRMPYEPQDLAAQILVVRVQEVLAVNASPANSPMLAPAPAASPISLSSFSSARPARISCMCPIAAPHPRPTTWWRAWCR